MTGRAAVGVRATHTNGATGRKWYPETFGAGVCVLDADGDDRPILEFKRGHFPKVLFAARQIADMKIFAFAKFADTTQPIRHDSARGR